MNKKMTTPYMDIINTIKRVVTKENIKLVENKFTKRGLSSSFVPSAAY